MIAQPGEVSHHDSASQRFAELEIRLRPGTLSDSRLVKILPEEGHRPSREFFVSDIERLKVLKELESRVDATFRIARCFGRHDRIQPHGKQIDAIAEQEDAHDEKSECYAGNENIECHIDVFRSIHIRRVSDVI